MKPTASYFHVLLIRSELEELVRQTMVFIHLQDSVSVMCEVGCMQSSEIHLAWCLLLLDKKGLLLQT